jgi:hypothetical protein
MVCVDLFVTFFADVADPALRDWFVVWVDVILVDHETKNVQEMK